MRRFLTFTVLMLALGGCGDPDAGKLFADVQYGTRCPTSNHCEGPQDRDVCGINNGEPCMGVGGTPRVSCTITEDGSGNYQVNFSVDQSEGFSLSVSQATIPTSGGLAGGANCGVRVVEGPNRYEGRCISQQPVSDPNPAEPDESVPGCRVNSVLFTDDMGNPTMEGQIECRDIPNIANPMLLLDVTQVGSGPGPASMPGRFRIANCQGLEIPSGG